MVLPKELKVFYFITKLFSKINEVEEANVAVSFSFFDGSRGQSSIWLLLGQKIKGVLAAVFKPETGIPIALHSLLQ